MARFFHWLIRLYQIVISPLIGPRCRYIPTCSQYALEALRIHGTIRGLVLTSRRICRCHPWAGFGYDPVPSKAIRFISFQQINSQTSHIAVPFRERFLNQNQSHHLGS
ncbi:MAG: membrane protein insertion efficiency factor YidD [Acinetobacter sp.]